MACSRWNLMWVRLASLADVDLGHGVPLDLVVADAAIALEQGERRALLEQDDVAGDHAYGFGPGIEIDEVDRLVEGHALAGAERDATAHQREVERQHRIAVLGVDPAEVGLKPARRVLERLRQRHDLDAGCFQPGKIGEIGAKLALDHDQAIGIKLGDGVAKRLVQIFIADGNSGRACKRQGLGELGAEIGIFPGLDAAVRQPERGIGVDRSPAKVGGPWIAGAGKRLLRRGIKIEISLLGSRLELFDRELHASVLTRPLRRIRRSRSLPARARAQARPSARSCRRTERAPDRARCSSGAADSG